MRIQYNIVFRSQHRTNSGPAYEHVWHTLTYLIVDLHLVLPVRIVGLEAHQERDDGAHRVKSALQRNVGGHRLVLGQHPGGLVSLDAAEEAFDALRQIQPIVVFREGELARSNSLGRSAAR